jgi:HD superfamily phosphohydrolase
LLINFNARLKFIKDIIHGAPRSEYPQSKRSYLFEIVANKRNSVDVDKFDYMMRDCHNVGIKSSVDALRLITFSRVIDNILCFNQKEAFNLYEIFHVRYSLFKRVYTHKVGKAIEYMITDALLAAEPVLKLSHSIDDMNRYMFLDDTIINEIERSLDPRLEESRQILSRLRKRDLYRW